jgi:hypothetical protein
MEDQEFVQLDGDVGPQHVCDLVEGDALPELVALEQVAAEHRHPGQTLVQEGLPGLAQCLVAVPAVPDQDLDPRRPLLPTGEAVDVQPDLPA